MGTALYFTDTFNRSNTSTGGAGTTTGAGTGWIDRAGGTWYIASTSLASVTGGNFLTNWLTRPTSENSLSQRAVVTFGAITTASNQVPIILLRVDSTNDNAYAAYIDDTGTLTLAKFLGGAQTVIKTASYSFTNSTSYIVDFTAVPNATAGTDLTAVVYAASAPGTPLATVQQLGDTTSALQASLSYGLAYANLFPRSMSAQLYNASTAPSLAVTPTTASVADGGTASVTATLSNSSASLTAAVSGGGTISTTTPTSGTAFTYTAPSSGTGTSTVTVTDATDGLTATSTITYGAGFVASPSSYPLGVATPFTLTGTGTSWVSTTVPTVAGGTGAYVSNFAVSGQVISGTLYPGSVAGSLTLGDSIDSYTATVTGTANVQNLAVWHGDSLTYGQNGSNFGTAAATRLATVLKGLGPQWTGSNQGNAGHTLTQMISELGATVNALFDATKKQNLLIVQGGHNDINQGANAATVISRIQTYLQTALAAHPWTIIWSTEPPAAYPGYPALFDSIRDAVNAYMRANWQSLGISAISDFASSQIMGQPGQEYNTTYYSSSDHTHPYDSGYTVWGNYDLTAIQNLFVTQPTGIRGSANSRFSVAR